MKDKKRIKAARGFLAFVSAAAIALSPAYSKAEDQIPDDCQKQSCSYLEKNVREPKPDKIFESSDNVNLRYSTEPRILGGNFLQGRLEEKIKTERLISTAQKTIETDVINFSINALYNKSNYLVTPTFYQDNKILDLGSSVDIKIRNIGSKEFRLMPLADYQTVDFRSEASNKLNALTPGLKASLVERSKKTSLGYSRRFISGSKRRVGHDIEFFSEEAGEGILLKYENDLNIEDLIVNRTSFALISREYNDDWEHQILISKIDHPLFYIFEIDLFNMKLRPKQNWYVGFSLGKILFYRDKTEKPVLEKALRVLFPFDELLWQPFLEAEYGVQNLFLTAKVGDSHAGPFYSIGLKGLF